MAKKIDPNGLPTAAQLQMEPKEDLKPVIVEVLPDANKLNAEGALYSIYLLYKLNIITRHGIKQSLDEIRKGTPDNLLVYLQGEVSKI